MNKVGAQTANWTTDEGKSVIETVLKANNNDIQFIFAQNDEMGIGAAQAVTAAGLVPGTDVKIATIDGTTGALEALAAGQLSFVAQYNPFFGDIAVDVVNKTLAGEEVESSIIVDSDTFDSPEAGEAGAGRRPGLLSRDRVDDLRPSDGAGIAASGGPRSSPAQHAPSVAPQRGGSSAMTESTPDRRSPRRIDHLPRRQSTRRGRASGSCPARCTP